MGIIACRKCESRYISYIIFYFITMILISLTFYSIFRDVTNIEHYNNALLNPFITNFGPIFCFIPELIIRKKSTEKKGKKSSKKNIFKKEKKNLAIEYIFNDFSDQITCTDILFIFIGCILLLITDFIKGEIQIKVVKKEDRIILNEQYNFGELIFIIVFAYLLYKMKFYRHQICSILIIIFIGICRYILKIFYYYESFEIKHLLLYIFLQIIADIFESIVIIYIKAIMEYKFFSPYKICYTIGLINTSIIIILMTIFSLIKMKKKNWFFSLEYEGYYYLDNINSIIKVYGYKIISLFFASLLYGILKLFFILTINKFTVYHTFLFIQNKESTINIFEEIKTKKGLIYVLLLLFSHFIELFIILIFIEIIELNFCGCNKNLKRNIKDRADIDIESIGKIINEGEDANSFDNLDEEEVKNSE